MKKGLIAFLLFLSLLAKAQKDSSRIRFFEPSDSTEKGVADGKLVSKEIGEAGGKIISDDGRVELIFPAGALTANTTISIQPTTNPAPNGAGKAYWFEPTGTQFKKPVEVIFHYTKEEEETCPADLMGLAMQDSKGKWEFLEYEDWDSTKMILKGTIHHFTGLSNVWKLRLEVGRKEIMVNDTTYILVVDIAHKFKNSRGRWTGLYELGVRRENDDFVWYVNGIPDGGDNEVGKVTPYPETLTNLGGGKKMMAYIYTAPDHLPQHNPVVIIGSFFLYSAKTQEFKYIRSLKCRITVVDRYKIKVISIIEVRKGCGGQVVDSATFVVQVKKDEVIVTNIENYLPVVKVAPDCPGSFRLEIVTGALQNDGMVHIFQRPFSSFTITKDNPPKITLVMETAEILAFKFTWVSRSRRIQTPVQSMILESQPNIIVFKANGQEQTYTPHNNDLYTIIVKPMPGQ